MWNTTVVWNVNTKAMGMQRSAKGAMDPMMGNMDLSSKWGWGALKETLWEYLLGCR